MKIVHCGYVRPPQELRERYGVCAHHPGRWVLNHAIAQKRAGMDVEIVTIAHKASQDFVAEIEGVKVHFLRTFHPFRLYTGFAIDRIRVGRYLRALQPDIVHAHGTEETFSLAAIHSGLPFCVTAQGLYFQIIPTLPKPIPLYARVYRMLEDWAWHRTRFAIGKSQYVWDDLKKQFPQLDLALIPNTYQAELDRPLAEREGFRVAFVGSIQYRKGVHLIAEAMKTLASACPTLEMHLFGNAPEGKGTDYENAHVGAMRSVLGERLVLHGSVPSVALFRELDRCRCLVAPSTEEMFGNQLIEGIMCGCHAVVTDHTAMAENVRRFGNGTIVPQEDAAALAAAIQTEAERAFSMDRAAAAQEKIRAYMSPAVVAAKHAAFYEHVVNAWKEGE